MMPALNLNSYLENAAAHKLARTVAKNAVLSETIRLLLKYVGNGVAAKTLPKFSRVMLEGQARNASEYKNLLGVTAILIIQYRGKSAKIRYALNAKARAVSQIGDGFTVSLSQCHLHIARSNLARRRSMNTA